MQALVEKWEGVDVPSRAFSDGGIHEAIMDYEDTVFYEILPRSWPAAIWITSRSPRRITTSLWRGWTITSPNLRRTVPTTS